MIKLHEAYRDFDNLPPLAPDEKMNPFSKFYFIPVEMPAPDVLQGIDMDHQMDPAKALALTDIKSLFSPGYQDVENGYCVMPDGTGFSTVKIDMPNVSPQEFIMFQGYGHMNNLQYKTWLPKLHLQQGAFTIENFGWGPLLFLQRQTMGKNMPGMEHNDMSKITPELMSKISMKANFIDIEDPKAFDPDFFAFIGGSIYTIDVLTGKRNDIVMIAYVRTKGNGLEMRYKVWFGVALEDGKLIRKIPEGASVPADKVCAVATHNAFEFTRMNTIAHDVCELIKANMTTMAMNAGK